MYKAAVLVAGVALWSIGICLAAEPAGRPAATQPAAPQADEPIARWLTDLASPDGKVRQTARQHLTLLKRDDLPKLQELVEKARPLAPSQAVMLKHIVREVYLAGESYDKDLTHGFMGILMDDATFMARDFAQPDSSLAPGVVVTERFPGFCASRMLLDGDVILGTSNPVQLFRGPADLKYAIGGLEPGTTVQLQVMRHGQIIQVPLTLDCKPSEVDSVDSAESFRLRRAAKFDNYWNHTFAPLLKEEIG